MKYPITGTIDCKEMGVSIPYDLLAEYSHFHFEGTVTVHAIGCNAIEPSPLELLMAFELNQCSFTALEAEILESEHE